MVSHRAPVLKSHNVVKSAMNLPSVGAMPMPDVWMDVSPILAHPVKEPNPASKLPFTTAAKAASGIVHWSMRATMMK